MFSSASVAYIMSVELLSLDVVHIFGTMVEEGLSGTAVFALIFSYMIAFHI